MIAMNKAFAFTVAAAFGLGGLVGAFVLFAGNPSVDSGAAVSAPHPVWTEVRWPFPIDQWGKGNAFLCKASDCGTELNLYLRAKIGFCNCTTGVADDEELERLSDFDFVGNQISALGPGRRITVAWMKGRSRAYGLTARNRPGKTAISVAFSDRCDAIVATAVVGSDEPATQESAVLKFLNSDVVLRWAESTLGL